MSGLKVMILEDGDAANLAGEILSILRGSDRVHLDGEIRRLSPSGPAPDLPALGAATGAAAYVLLLTDPLRPSAWLREALCRPPGVPLFAVAPTNDPEPLYALHRLGADEVFTTPLSPAHLLPRLWRHLEPLAGPGSGNGAGPGSRPSGGRGGEGDAGRRAAVARAASNLREKAALRSLIGECPVFRHEVEKLPLVARSDAGVLIRGESGTGKELVARAIHYLRPAPRGPFLPVNCGAIPAELAENELFGHARSAYTGADSERRGLVDEADGGTLFLDEVDALPAAAQAKLLRFLQEKEYRRLGSTRVLKSAARVVAATNADLEEAMAAGRFRTDLYYRLNVIPVNLPPLRSRKEDIPLLARHFLRRHARDAGLPGAELTRSALEVLASHDWPGNVRQLEHVVHRTLILGAALHDDPTSGDWAAEGPDAARTDGCRRIEAHHLQMPGCAGSPPGTPAFASFQEAKAEMVASFEKTYLRRTLAAARGNITRAADLAGKNRRAFWELLRKHEIDAAPFRSARAD